MKGITGTTVLTGLLGSPVKHSKSPLMHNKAFELLDLDYRYLCFEVDTTNLKTAIEGLRTIGARGFNLTMPVKEAVMALLDELTPAASLIHAVNTVCNENGRLTGYNTDGIGFMRSVREAGADPAGKEMTLMGCGGAVNREFSNSYDLGIYSDKANQTPMIAEKLLAGYDWKRVREEWDSIVKGE